MDSNSGTEKSLPSENLMPRWMKKSTRYNYSDICASPPSNEDGFIHINRHRLQQQHSSSHTTTTTTADTSSNVECFQNSRKKTGFQIDSPNDVVLTNANESKIKFEPSTLFAKKQDCEATAGLKDTSKFYKSIATTTASSLVNLAVASQQEGFMTPASSNRGTAEITSQISVLSKTKPSATEFESKFASLNLSDAAQVDSIIVTKPSNNGANQSTPQQLVEKGKDGLLSLLQLQQQDDTTPLTTPNQTPTCSPQIARRGNPYFTSSGEKSGNSSGNWLFRPSVKAEGEKDSKSNLYETKIDMNRSSSSSPSSPTQKVRYVPRPSELRELNFWSPTSM